MKKESAILWMAAVLIIGGTVFVLAKLSKPEIGPSDERTAQLPAISETDLVTGNRESNTTLVEYSDFQCPACAAYHPLIKKMLSENGQDFRFVYRHFPLRQHAQAKEAAYAAEAAGRQNKFWEMHDLIFAGQNNWAQKISAKDIFLTYARSLNLDIERFSQDRGLSEIKDKVETDLQGGLKINVNATPTFFLNGKKIQPRNYDEFVNFIKQAGIDSSFSPVASPAPAINP